MTIMREWEKACIRKSGRAIDLADGRTAGVDSKEHQKFMENAGTSARVLINNNKVELYYNSKTGDVFIPKHYDPAEVDEIKKIFLNFISKDDHQDVDFKNVLIRM